MLALGGLLDKLGDGLRLVAGGGVAGFQAEGLGELAAAALGAVGLPAFGGARGDLGDEARAGEGAGG